MSNYSQPYMDVLEQIEQLSAPQGEQLLEQLMLKGTFTRTQLKNLAEYLDDRSNGQNDHSVLELQGLGKELWQSIEAQEYVRQERDSWHG